MDSSKEVVGLLLGLGRRGGGAREWGARRSCWFWGEGEVAASFGEKGRWLLGLGGGASPFWPTRVWPNKAPLAWAGSPRPNFLKKLNFELNSISKLCCIRI